MSIGKVLILETHDELYRLAASVFQRYAGEAVSRRGRFLVALSGGGTPQPLYRLLAKPPFRDSVPWQETHVFWGDERMVPPDHPESNYLQAHKLLLDMVPISTTNVHRIRGEEEPVAAAEHIAEELQSLAAKGRNWPRFDLVLLGMGSDGHTASLFPGSPFPEEPPRPAKAVTADYDGRPVARVTLTPPVLNDARHILFLVTGAEKAATLANVFSGEPDPIALPAQRIEPNDGSLIWLVDQAAAAQLID